MYDYAPCRLLLYQSWKKNFIFRHRICFVTSTYCIRHNFHVQILSRFWTRFGNSRGLNFTISDVFITINRHTCKLKWKFLRGLTREIRGEKNMVKITMYTVIPTCMYVYMSICGVAAGICYTICPKKNYNQTFRMDNFQSSEWIKV